MMRLVYSDDFIRLYHGDALDVMVALDLQGVKIDAVVTDPPYSSGGNLRSDRLVSVVQKYQSSHTKRSLPTFEGDHRDQRGYLAWSHLWMSLARNITKPGGDLLAFIDWRQLPTMSDAVQSAGFIWKGVGVWHKKFGRPLPGTFSAGYELIVHGVNGPRDKVDRYASAVFTENTPPNKVHLSQKPLPVMHWLLELTPKRGLILDPFVGSGTTLIAAKETGRMSIGVEADEQHLEGVIRRIQATPERLALECGF
jgi:site-specific DNA-methyltransferase (adenine-specific)